MLFSSSPDPCSVPAHLRPLRPLPVQAASRCLAASEPLSGWSRGVRRQIWDLEAVGSTPTTPTR